MNKYKTIFISDIHLGTKACNIDLLLDFLKYNNSEKLYLIGDIIDFWRIKSKVYWPQSHNDAIQKILRKARKGTEVIYITGNHDENLDQFKNIIFGNIPIKLEDTHIGVDGKKYLITHGDDFDGIMLYHRWLAILGDHGYQFLNYVNRVYNKIRNYFGYPYLSLSKHVKTKVKNIASFIYKFEETVSNEALKRNFDGVICGHIHHPEIKNINGIIYMNDGDFCETCSALVEHFDGTFEIIHWKKK